MQRLRLALALLLSGGAMLWAGPGDAQAPESSSTSAYSSAPLSSTLALPPRSTPLPEETPRPRPRAVAPRPEPANPAALPTPAASAAPSARLAPGTPIPPAELEVLVDGLVRSAMAREHIAGVAVSIVQNGQVVLKKGYGFAGPNRAVDPDRTLFRVGSISKTFTWIALMKEVEAGHIRLNSPINLYLPEDLQIRDQGFTRPILVRDLPTHTPGFEDRALGQLFEQDPDRVRPLAAYLRQERPRRVREAGSLPTYSNYGASLAGEAISWVNARPYQDIVESEIIHPLGLSHTTFREPYPFRNGLPAPMPANLAADVSTGYRWAGGEFVPEGFEYVTQVAPAGAASSSAGDMARYMLMILNGGQLDGATIYNANTALGFRTTLQSSAPGVEGWDDGFMEFALPGGFTGRGHGGDTLWFHSELVTVPELNLGVFITTNTDTGPRLTSRFVSQIVGQFYAAPQNLPRPGSPELAAERGVYAGSYLNTRRPYSGLQKFIFLIIGQIEIRVTKDGHLLAGDLSWVPDGPEGRFQQTKGPLKSAFKIEDGRAVRWLPPTGATAFDRIGLLYQARTMIVVATLALLASIATVVGVFTRDRRESRQTPMQSRASLVQTTIAILWLAAATLFGGWASRSQDLGWVMYNWPGPFVILASACALMAAILTVLTMLMAPAIWRGGRRVESWTPWRKLRFTLTTAIFAAFSLVLGAWGALTPWSG